MVALGRDDLHFGAVTDAGDVEFTGEALVDAGDHVLHQGAGQAVQRASEAVFGGTRDDQVTVFDGDLDLSVVLEAELALGALDLHFAVGDSDLDALWNFDSFFADTGHVGTSAFWK